MTKYAILPDGLSLADVERMLDEGKIYAEMQHGRFWKVRRNGQTAKWKTRPKEWQIPLKAGLRACGYIAWDNYRSFHVVAS